MELAPVLVGHQALQEVVQVDKTFFPDCRFKKILNKPGEMQRSNEKNKITRRQGRFNVAIDTIHIKQAYRNNCFVSKLYFVCNFSELKKVRSTRTAQAIDDSTAGFSIGVSALTTGKASVRSLFPIVFSPTRFRPLLVAHQLKANEAEYLSGLSMRSAFILPHLFNQFSMCNGIRRRTDHADLRRT